MVDRDALDLATPETPTGWPDSVVVHPGAAYASRRWPPERFAAVVRWLADQGHHVVVTGSASERALVASIVAEAGLPPAADLAGVLDLAQLAALVAASRLVVCGDTGVAHLATAYRRPSVVLFGPVSPALWGPPARREHVVVWRGDGHGDPWGSDVDPALSAVQPADVGEAAQGLLSRPG
jgi:ADP-heptose:LPS heptosyltransferase